MRNHASALLQTGKVNQLVARTGRGEMVARDFFQRDPLSCARDLIGCELNWSSCAGLIVETEAYNAIGDEASHCFVRPSARAFVERNQAGAAYVYFNYGVHWMLNVLVKGDENGFVLIRALEPTRGIALMRKRRDVHEVHQLCSGPGKLTQALAITGRHDEMDLCGKENHCFRERLQPIQVIADERIGIRRSAHLPWRFTLRDSAHVSRKVPSSRARVEGSVEVTDKICNGIPRLSLGMTE
ncbi:MAG: 3-methyladenine DNA glycosylase [Verrucomicrobia bacterium]|nr:MAG: 3-methyladenine DNA glycosylase [Verrucomicrobiota bacterium]